MEGSCGGGLQLADVNRDGNLDLVVADHCSGVYVYLGDGKGAWQMVTEKLESAMSRKTAAEDAESNYYGGAETVALGDINGDGFLDWWRAARTEGAIHRVSRRRHRQELEGNREQRPSVARRDMEAGDVPGTGWCNDVHLVDMNDDGRLDVVAGYYNGAARLAGRRQRDISSPIRPD